MSELHTSISTPRRVFVTVGSTLFPALTSAILSGPILELLSSLGVTRLTVQYGRADLPSDLSHLSDVQLADASGSARYRYTGRGELEVEVLRFTDEFERRIKDSEAVISHAGAGSILSVLRTRPPIPLLVVPNTSLMDNHQSELADALEHQGYLSVSSVEELEQNLPMFLKKGKEQKTFPDLDNSKLRDILDETMGFI